MKIIVQTHYSGMNNPHIDTQPGKIKKGNLNNVWKLNGLCKISILFVKAIEEKVIIKLEALLSAYIVTF